jgi:1-acyl-sn-glycerol-3-phosphate acyltransferase
MMASCIAGLARLISGVQPRWIGCAPAPEQRIYFANHTSNLDAMVLWAVLPRELRERTRPVAARDYWTTNALRLYLAANVFNAVLIERKKVTAHDNPLTAMLDALSTTHSLIIFPEGGRNPGPEVGPFKSGLYHLAKDRRDVTLVPAYLENLNRILPKGEVLPVPILSRVTFGLPIKLEPTETKADFLVRAHAAVERSREL